MATQQDVSSPQDVSPALLEYFKSLRDEIHIRIQEHTRLVWIKLVVLAAVISFLMTRSDDVISQLCVTPPSSWLYIIWSIPLLAVVFDTLIASNLRDINNLGHYIKEYFESQVFRPIRNDIAEVLMFAVHVDEKRKFPQALGSSISASDQESFWKGELGKDVRRKLLEQGFPVVKEPKIGQTRQNEWRIIDVKIRHPSSRERAPGPETSGGPIESEHQVETESGSRQFLVRVRDGCAEVYRPRFGLWEEKAAQAANKYRCYTWLDMGVIWLLTLGAGLCSFLMRSDLGIEDFDWLEKFAIVVCVLGVGFALWQLLASVMMERRF